MSGRVAVVTGGAAGLGWAIAQALAEHGWHLVLLDADEEAVRRRADEGVAALAVDVSKRESVEEAFAEVERVHGPPALLVNNAGVTTYAPLEDLAWDEWRRVLSVDLDGAFHCLQAAGRLMLSRGGGSIVNIVSIAAERGTPGRAAYCVAKAGLIALTRVAAVEWASRGVQVNAVGPGYVETPLLRDAIDTGRLDEEAILARIPAARIATAGEVAAAVRYLASPASSYVTGQVLWVDGGFLADYGVPARP